VEAVEVTKQVVIKDLTPRNPTPLLWTISFPIHEILETSTPPSGIHYAAHRVGRTTSDHPRRRRTRRRGQQRTEENRLEAGDMKGGVYSKRCRQFESDHNRVNDSLHHKRTNELW
jgi:hypothetical protein